MTSSLHIGVQLCAPEGFCALEKDRTYYLLKSDPDRDRVLLVFFVMPGMSDTAFNKKPAGKRRTRPVPYLIRMSRGQFELGLEENHIRLAPVQSNLPPWLSNLDGRNLHATDSKRKVAKHSHADRIDAILSRLWPLIQRVDEVLALESPDLAINRHARACFPPQNETRLRLYFYAYLLFGRSRAALHYSIGRIGRWDRCDEKHRGKKFGRPRVRGGKLSGFGMNDPELRKKIEDGYRRHSGLGISMNKIYRDTLKREFGCMEVRNEKGVRSFYHPEGLPFPSKGQFSEHIKRVIGQDIIYLTKYGAARTRNRLAPSLGKFTESVLNAMQKTESDGYWCDDVAQGYQDGEPLPKLCVVTIRCSASGLIAGIGFSLGGETAAAYRMAKFCMAIDKVRFCRLFGFTITKELWPNEGLSPHSIADRGPGSTAGAYGTEPEFRPIIAEMSPSWMGQSKANVESSHPRSVHIEGRPAFKTTTLTVTQLAAREIVRAISANECMDVSGRFNPEHFTAGVSTTPLALYKYLDERGRNDALSMAFEDAVRTFLTQRDVSVRADGVYLHEQRYDSPALRDTDLLNKSSVSGRSKVRAYILDMCVRHIWIEVDGRLIELDAQLAILSHDSTLYISLTELAQIHELRKQAAAAHDEHRDAASSAYARQFEETYGVPFVETKRLSGKSRTGTASARREAAEAKKYLRTGSKG